MLAPTAGTNCSIVNTPVVSPDAHAGTSSPVTAFALDGGALTHFHFQSLFNSVHRRFARAATLIDMATQRKNKDEQHAGLELLIEQFRAAEKRALVRRGVKLWTRAEAERASASVRPIGPDKIN